MSNFEATSFLMPAVFVLTRKLAQVQPALSRLLTHLATLRRGERAGVHSMRCARRPPLILTITHSARAVLAARAAHAAHLVEPVRNRSAPLPALRRRAAPTVAAAPAHHSGAGTGRWCVDVITPSGADDIQRYTACQRRLTGLGEVALPLAGGQRF